MTFYFYLTPKINIVIHWKFRIKCRFSLFLSDLQNSSLVYKYYVQYLNPFHPPPIPYFKAVILLLLILVILYAWLPSYTILQLCVAYFRSYLQFLNFRLWRSTMIECYFYFCIMQINMCLQPKYLHCFVIEMLPRPILKISHRMLDFLVYMFIITCHSLRRWRLIEYNLMFGILDQNKIPCLALASLSKVETPYLRFFSQLLN